MGGKMTGGWLIAIVVIGGGLFLLCEHPAIFWLIAVPVAILGVSAFVRWLKK